MEDNTQIRNHIASALKKNYQVLTAENGLKGYEQVQYHLPQLVITDLLMPEMDGLTFCQKMFSNPATMRIPVIILSAVNTQTSIAKGYKIGVDDYITKPFSTNILLARVDNLMQKRNRAQQKSPLNNDSLSSISDTDNDFLSLIKEIVYREITNNDFKIDDLVKETNMSRSKFYRKVKELTHSSPVNYIRKIRLEYAANLLLKTDDTVAQVAYLSGFSDVKYFSKSFAKEMNVYPSEYKKQFQ